MQGQRCELGGDGRPVAGQLSLQMCTIFLYHLTVWLIDNNVDVSPLVAYEIKRIDTDYFWEECGVKGLEPILACIKKMKKWGHPLPALFLLRKIHFAAKGNL